MRRRRGEWHHRDSQLHRVSHESQVYMHHYSQTCLTLRRSIISWKISPPLMPTNLGDGQQQSRPIAQHNLRIVEAGERAVLQGRGITLACVLVEGRAGERPRLSAVRSVQHMNKRDPRSLNVRRGRGSNRALGALRIHVFGGRLVVRGDGSGRAGGREVPGLGLHGAQGTPRR